MSELSDIAKQMGKKGGLTTSKRHGKQHYINLANNMNAKRKEKKLSNINSAIETSK